MPRRPRTRRAVASVVAMALLMLAGLVGWDRFVEAPLRAQRGDANNGVGLGGEPTVLHPPRSFTATCVNARPGWADRETSAGPGVSGLPDPRTEPVNGPVVGFLDQTWARCGESVGLHLHALDAAPTFVTK